MAKKKKPETSGPDQRLTDGQQKALKTRTYDVVVVSETEHVFRVQAATVADAEAEARRLWHDNKSAALDIWTDLVEVGPTREVKVGAAG